MKLSDYVFRTLADWGTRHVFLVSGGGAMHLNDSVGQESRIKLVCNHHEQASAMAAEAYARLTGKPGVVSVTTGPGGINALNGVFGAWTDSVPMLVISGQVRRDTCMRHRGVTGMRQLGDQEADIVAMVERITKYAVMVSDPSTIRYHLERAYHLAQSGRPGPCWLDIPVDVQSSQIEPATLTPYDSNEDDLVWNQQEVDSQCREILSRIQTARRPVILAGTGVRAAGTLEEFKQLIHQLRVPITTAWTHDLIASDDPLFCGRPGTIGDRAGNFVVQNSDVLLVLGSRLNLRQVSYNWQSFAPHAFKIQVDVDAAELDKPLVQSDLAVHCDLKVFLKAMLGQIGQSGVSGSQHSDWLDWCRERVRRYPVVLDRHRSPGPPLNPYHFMEQLSSMLRADDVVLCGNASACILPFQVMRIKEGQRLISNSGSASMGHDLPAAIGAAFARNGQRVICLAGDGSVQMNIQELQTMVHHQLPIKLFVLNNDGYLSIRSTQANFFGRLTGESPTSGVSFPDIVKVGTAYGIPSMRIDRCSQMPDVQRALENDGPAVIEVVLDPAQGFEPRSKAKQLPDGKIVSPALDDMYPFLDEEELRQNRLWDGEA